MNKRIGAVKVFLLLLVVCVVGAFFTYVSMPDVKAEAATYARDPMPPVITLTPESSGGYAREVKVTIEWCNENSYKFYSVKGRMGEDSGEKRYVSPFTITAEGSNEIKAYYYDMDGVKRYAVATVDYVDNTPPNDFTIAESIRVDVDLKANDPMRLVLRARDFLSGVKRVYIKDLGREFELIDPLESMYSVSCKGLLEGVNLVVEDNAGNERNFSYSLSGYDRAAIDEYNAKYLALDKSIYASEALGNVESAFTELSNIFEYVDADASTVSAYKRAVNDALSTDCKTLVAYTSTAATVPTGADITIKYGDTDRPAGDKLILRVGKVRAADVIANEKSKTATKLSGYQNAVVSPFSLSLEAASGAAMKTYREMCVSVNMPLGTDVGKVYYDNDGALELLRTEIRDGRMVFYTKNFGDFYFIADMEYRNKDSEEKGLTIAGTFYPAATLGIVGGVVGGIMILGGVGTFLGLYFVSKKADKKPK